MAVAIRVLEHLEPELEVVAAALVGQVVRQLRLELRLLAVGAERDPAGTGHRVGGAEDLRRPLVAGSTCTSIGQSSVKLPTFTLKNVRSLMTRWYSPLYIRE